MKTDSDTPWALTAVTWSNVPTGGMTAMLPKNTLPPPPLAEPAPPLLCRLAVLLLGASSIVMRLLLDDPPPDFQLWVLGFSSDPPGERPDGPEEDPKWRANLGDEEVKLASNALVLMSKTCILKCWGMPPS